MMKKLRVPCSYQGGKQRVASEIVDSLLESAQSETTMFYDLCCGSGAISVELVNRGVNPRRIVMLDGSSWGAFWSAIGAGKFAVTAFKDFLGALPSEKRALKTHMNSLAAQPVIMNEAELYPLLQACSFGGKQIWRNGDRWENAFFRDFWEPTATSVRRSPANPMQPNALELERRVYALSQEMRGITCIHADIFSVLEQPIPDDSVVYVDPPYRGTTGYGLGFNIDAFVEKYLESNSATLFISEGVPLADEAKKLSFGGPKGGISGVRSGKHEEWLSKFQRSPNLRE